MLLIKITDISAWKKDQFYFIAKKIEFVNLQIGLCACWRWKHCFTSCLSSRNANSHEGEISRVFTLPFHRKSPLLPSVRFLLSRPVFPTFCKCLVILFCLYDIWFLIAPKISQWYIALKLKESLWNFLEMFKILWVTCRHYSILLHSVWNNSLLKLLN